MYLGGGEGGCPEGSENVDRAAWTNGEGDILRKSSGSRLVEPESRIVWYASETNISVSPRKSSRGIMLST